MRVSVCMPTYNQENFIEQAIKSVLMQKGCKLELIIANDCSTDKTLEVCQKFQKANSSIIKIINQEKNKGVVENTVDGLLACKGEYIAILEGDDYWIDEYKLQKQIEILDNKPEVSLVHTNWIDFIDKTKEYKSRIIRHKDYYLSEHLAGNKSIKEVLLTKYRGIRLSSVCFRSCILHNAISLDSSIFSRNYPTFDIMLFYLSAHEGILEYLQDKTTAYRIQEESISFTNNSTKRAYYTLGCLHIKVFFIKYYHLDIKYEDLHNEISALYRYAWQLRDSTILHDIQKLSSSLKGRHPLRHYFLKLLLTIRLKLH